MPESASDNGFYDIERFMAEHEVLLAYRDEINDRTVQHLLTLTEAKLTSVLDNKKFRKRVFQILVECLQNVVNHAHHTDKGGRSSILLMGRGEGQLFIITGNMIDAATVDSLRRRLDEVNSIGSDEVRETYSDKLRDAAFSLKGGAGLGLLDMYRRSGNRIGYEFVKVDDSTAFFTLKVTVNTRETLI